MIDLKLNVVTKCLKLVADLLFWNTQILISATNLPRPLPSLAEHTAVKVQDSADRCDRALGSSAPSAESPKGRHLNVRRLEFIELCAGIDAR
jgi:hypothetical protein